MKTNLLLGLVMLLALGATLADHDKGNANASISDLKLRNIEALTNNECNPLALHLVPCYHHGGNECRTTPECVYVHCSHMTFCN